MKLYLEVKPNSAVNRVTQIDATHFRIEVKEPPVRNKANLAVIELIAEFLRLPKSSLSIKRGANAKRKTLEIHSSRQLL
jgi:uncharacterized protein